MNTVASQSISVLIVYSTVCSGTHQREHQSSAGLCEENPLATGGVPSQRGSDAENVSILLRHHATDT